MSGLIDWTGAADLDRLAARASSHANRVAVRIVVGNSMQAVDSQPRGVMVYGIDLSEERLVTLAPRLLEILLADRATGRNIIWATDHYETLGAEYSPANEIVVSSIVGENEGLIRPRVAKSAEHRWDRTKDKGEIFTPAWLCNEQNNAVDDAWFGRTGVFNIARGKRWEATVERVSFSGSRTWQRYVDDRRMEVACGEAPYLVSRYDAFSGEPIEQTRRVGILDRKLRVVTENASDDDEWRVWARRAVESVYAYELQGDNLLLARENVLATYVDYSLAARATEPSAKELTEIATVISWNLWQMDGLTGLRPFAGTATREGSECTSGLCVVRDWRAKRTHKYVHLVRGIVGP